MAAATQEALLLRQLQENFGIQTKHPIAFVEDIVSKCVKTHSCTRGANTLRQNFTSFGTIWRMGLFQIITFQLTKWQPTSSQNP